MMNTKMTIDELSTALPIAPGLEQQYTGESGLSKEYIDNAVWFNGPSGSIFLKFVPQDMTKEDIHTAFDFLGPINRIDIVLNKTSGASYQMAFIHFDYWYSSPESLEVRHHIVSLFPRPYQMYSLTAMRELSITINTRPVPKTTYNIDQMSDMLQRLQDDYHDTIQRQADQIAMLTEKLAALEKKQKHAETAIWDLDRDVSIIHENTHRLFSDLDEFTDWSDGIAEDVAKATNEIAGIKQWGQHIGELVNDFKEITDENDIGELVRDMKAKQVEYSSMSRVFTRDIAELIQIRTKIVPKMEMLIQWMCTQPDAKRFLEEHDLNRPVDS